jgi:hypothetical protein
MKQLAHTRIVCLLFIAATTITTPLWSQKMLLLEHAKRVRPDKMYIGQVITFQLNDDDNGWYTRTIQDILPESNSLLLDGYLVPLKDITAIKVHRRPVWRIIGGTLLSLGISLAAATTGAAIYRDDEQNYPLLIGSSAATLGTSKLLLKKRKVHLNKQHRLRIIEIRFDPAPTTPGKVAP